MSYHNNVKPLFIVTCSLRIEKCQPLSFDVTEIVDVMKQKGAGQQSY